MKNYIQLLQNDSVELAGELSKIWDMLKLSDIEKNSLYNMGKLFYSVHNSNGDTIDPLNAGYYNDIVKSLPKMSSIAEGLLPLSIMARTILYNIYGYQLISLKTSFLEFMTEENFKNFTNISFNSGIKSSYSFLEIILDSSTYSNKALPIISSVLPQITTEFCKIYCQLLQLLSQDIQASVPYRDVNLAANAYWLFSNSMYKYTLSNSLHKDDAISNIVALAYYLIGSSIEYLDIPTITKSFATIDQENITSHAIAMHTNSLATNSTMQYNFQTIYSNLEEVCFNNSGINTDPWYDWYQYNSALDEDAYFRLSS